jgi:hypothetical protein
MSFNKGINMIARNVHQEWRPLFEKWGRPLLSLDRFSRAWRRGSLRSFRKPFTDRTCLGPANFLSRAPSNAGEGVFVFVDSSHTRRIVHGIGDPIVHVDPKEIEKKCGKCELELFH